MILECSLREPTTCCLKFQPRIQLARQKKRLELRSLSLIITFRIVLKPFPSMGRIHGKIDRLDDRSSLNEFLGRLHCTAKKSSREKKYLTAYKYIHQFFDVLPK